MFVYSCKPDEVLIIERDGRYHKTISQSGLGLKSPFDHVAGRVNTRETQLALRAQIKTSDNFYVEMTATAAFRVVDAKKYHYGALDAASQLGVLLSMSVTQEASALTAMEMADCSKVLDRIRDEKSSMLRDTYGIELQGLAQTSLNLPENLKLMMQAVSDANRAAAEKAQDATDAVRRMQQGLGSDVQVRKPLSFRKGVASSQS